MVETNNPTRKFIANACLHYQIGSSRSFLRRNLRDILDSHERAIRLKSNDASREDMIANERRAAGWDYPTREMLNDLIKGDKPVLQLASLHIRHPNSQSKSKKRKRTSRDDSEDYPDWLPDPQAETTWDCEVKVSVRATQPSKHIYVESRPATIHQHQQTNGEHDHFEIILAEPFLIEVGKLLVKVETGTNGFRNWRRTVDANYELEVSIQCSDLDDTADFLGELEDQHRSKYAHLRANEESVRAVWKSSQSAQAQASFLL